MAGWQEFTGLNRGYVLELYDKYRRDPSSVDAETRAIFERWTPPADEAPSVPDGLSVQKIVGAVNLAQSIRRYGHLAAQLDPLGSRPPGDPSLLPETHGVSEEDLRSLPANLIWSPLCAGAANMLEVIDAFRRIYCSTTGYDFAHVFVPEERQWLRHAVECGQFRAPSDPIDPVAVLDRLTEVEAFERFLQRTFPGKTRFSIEGLDMLVPVLDEVIGDAAEAGTRQILIGMAHRGRLNVMAHVLNKPYAQMLAEFKDPVSSRSFREDMAWTGDVKYHAGAHRAIKGGARMELVVSMPPNPSHLEAIDPIVEGMARAAGTMAKAGGPPTFDPTSSMPILIHGDAAFPGQGVVAETLNLSRLPGYTTGGTIHIIVNNQLGFTAGPEDSYSTSYASGLARGFKIPIVHVNADDPEACIEAARLAIAYRAKFKLDFLIDLIGYRRHGHNEGDEPAFTQPLMYQNINAHPTVREIWAHTLVERGAISKQAADDMNTRRLAALQAAMDSLQPEQDLVEPEPPPSPAGAAARARTAVPLDRLREINTGLLATPAGFTFHRKLERAREKRAHVLEAPDERTIDWAVAEELAMASILADYVSIRLTGEDVERGTFSHRHAVFHDAKTGKRHVPLQSFPQARAAFEVHNTPLTENAVIGFEYGYNIQEPSRLVIWEAQYRRLHQRRAGDDRRVHRGGARQMGAAAVARAAPAARPRRAGARPRERATGALPATGGRHQPAHRELHDRRAVLPPAPAAGSAARDRSAAPRRADAEEPPAAPARGIDPTRAGRGTVPDRPPGRRGPAARGRGASRADVFGQGLHGSRGQREAGRAARRRDLPAGAALPGVGPGRCGRHSIRSRTPPRSCGSRKNRRTWARGTSFARCCSKPPASRALGRVARPRSASPAEGSAARHAINQQALVDQAFGQAGSPRPGGPVARKPAQDAALTSSKG